jgi:hypothetical protein
MGIWGAIIMSFFGAVFAALTLHWQWDVSSPLLGVPFVVFVAIALTAAYVARLPGSGIVPSEKTERAIMWSSIGEGVGLFLAANIVINLHRPDLLLPAMALVVGLHFLPIARAARFFPFYALGAALLVSAVLGFVLPGPRGGEIAGLAAAVSLWIASVLAVRRDWRARRHAAPAAGSA